MIARVNHYYQQPASPDFIKHMINETGLTDPDKEIVLDLRQYIGSSDLHAETMKIPLKLYNERVGKISQRLMSELFRLAQIGYTAEQKML